MAKKPDRRTAAGKFMEDLFVETAYTYFLLKEGGKQIGSIQSSGSYWGMLRSLKLEGPQTVPQIARSRPVSRQGIQKLANEMVKEGLIEFIDNPAHKKSKLLRITAKGEELFQDLTKQNAQAAEFLAQELKVDVSELEVAVKVMSQLRDKLKKLLLN